MNIHADTEFLADEPGDGCHPLFRAVPSSVEFNKLRKRLLRQARQAIEDFAMAKSGERWLVALSGGKDSYGLLALLLDLKWRGLLPVELLACNLDQGQPNFPKHILPDYLEKLGVRLTSPDRVVYPGQGITKSQLVAYYEDVAEAMLPHIKERPLSLVRCPQGRAKHCFFQKHDTGGFPDQLRSRAITEKDGESQDYFYVEDLAGLVAGTQMNVLEWHVWGSHFDTIERPDRLVFDIDPDEGLDFSAITSAALDIRDRLKAMTGGQPFKSETIPIGAVGANTVKVQQMLDRVGFR